MATNSNGMPENLWGYGKRLRFIVSALSDYLGGRSDDISILDVGCGNGSQLAIPLASYGYRILAVDPDEKSIHRAKQLGRDCINLRFESLAIQECPADSFDAVVLAEVLEHMPDPQAILIDVSKRLNSRGIVVVTVPNGYGEFEIDSWIFRHSRLQSLIDRIAKNSRDFVASTENVECGHVQFFTWSSIHKLFKECNLEVLRHGVGSFLCGPAIGHTLARSRKFLDWNARVADRLPKSLVSSWFFVLRPVSVLVPLPNTLDAAVQGEEISQGRV